MRVWVFHRQNQPTRIHGNIRTCIGYFYYYCCSICVPSSHVPFIHFSSPFFLRLFNFWFCWKFYFYFIFTTQGRVIHTLRQRVWCGSASLALAHFLYCPLCFVSLSQQLNYVWKGIRGWNWFELSYFSCFFLFRFFLFEPRFVPEWMQHVFRFSTHSGDLKGIQSRQF